MIRLNRTGNAFEIVGSGNKNTEHIRISKALLVKLSSTSVKKQFMKGEIP